MAGCDCNTPAERGPGVLGFTYFSTDAAGAGPVVKGRTMPKKRSRAKPRKLSDIEPRVLRTSETHENNHFEFRFKLASYNRILEALKTSTGAQIDSFVERVLKAAEWGNIRFSHVVAEESEFVCYAYHDDDEFLEQLENGVRAILRQHGFVEASLPYDAPDWARTAFATLHSVKMLRWCLANGSPAGQVAWYARALGAAAREPQHPRIIELIRAGLQRQESLTKAREAKSRSSKAELFLSEFESAQENANYSKTQALKIACEKVGISERYAWDILKKKY